MKKKQDLFGILLAGCVGIVSLAGILLRAFLPRFILFSFDFGGIGLLALIALVSEHYLTETITRDYRLIPFYAALIFGLFPWASGFIAPVDAIWTAVIAAVLVTVLAYLYDSMIDRLSSGPTARLAPFICACGLFLAMQCLCGII